MPGPVKSNLKTESFPVAMIVAAFLFGWYFYQHFPRMVASHWDQAGQVNGYLSRGPAAFILPLVLLGIYLLFIALPYLDPKRAEYAKFESAYFAFRNILMAGLFLIYLATGLFNLGYHIDVKFSILIVVGIMFLAMGYLMPQIKPNWFVGIRTPWTISSPTVWQKTHEVGGKLLMVFGAVLVIGAFLPSIITIWLFVAGITAMILGTIVYSYIEYQKEQNQK